MSDRNLQYSEGIKPEHSNPNPTIRGFSHDWKGQPRSREGAVLLPDGVGRDANAGGRDICSPERLLGTRLNEAGNVGVVRRDIPEAQGALGGVQRDCSHDLEIEPIPTFGPKVHAAIVGGLVVCTGLWYALGWAAAQVVHFIAKVMR